MGTKTNPTPKSIEARQLHFDALTAPLAGAGNPVPQSKAPSSRAVAETVTPTETAKAGTPTAAGFLQAQVLGKVGELEDALGEYREAFTGAAREQVEQALTDVEELHGRWARGEVKARTVVSTIGRYRAGLDALVEARRAKRVKELHTQVWAMILGLVRFVVGG